MRLRGLDLLLIALYLLGITLFGLRFRSKASGTSLKSYFLADKVIPWWAIALSIVSAETSTLTIISVPGVAYTGDFGFLQIVFGYLLGRVVVAALFLPRYIHGDMLTAYQLIDRRFGPALHKVTAALFLLTRAAAEGVRVFAVSIVVSIAIGTGDVLSIAIITLLTLLYTFEGGMAAVIWTDVAQMAIYLGGTLVAMLTLGTHVHGGWPQILHVTHAAHKLTLFHFAFNLTQSYTFWAGVLGGTFLTMASHGTDQLMVQRMLAARNLRESRLALLSSGAVIFVQFSLFLLIGAGLYVFYNLGGAALPSALSPDRIFPTFIVAEMPQGIAGLLIAAILAAAMSNLSAALNSLSSTTVVDFYLHLRPNADGHERLLLSRSATLAWACVLFAIAVYSIHVGGKGHVVETGLSIASVAYGSLLGVFLLGTLTRYATESGTIIGMVCGFALNLYLWLGSFPVRMGGFTLPRIAFTWFVLLGAVVTFCVGSLASLIVRRASARAMVALLLCLGLAHSAVAQSSRPGQSLQFAPVDDLIQNAIAARKLPGAVLIIGHQGSVVYRHAYGVRKLAGEPGVDGRPSAAEPMTLDTVFDMASLTKCLVTAVAVLQLQEAGKLDVDHPVVEYLPEFAANGKQSVTVRDLLTHYSGLPEDVDLKDAWGLAAPDKAEGLRRALTSPLTAAPGTHFEYSDVNFITLGALVERLSGQTLDVYAQQHIFTPLGMTQTRYLPLANCGSRCNLVAEAIAPTAHDDQGTAATNPDFDHLLRGVVHDPTTRRMGGVAGHAGVFSTAADTARFAQALLDKLLRNSGPFPLQQSTLQRMTRPQQPATAQTGATIFTAEGQLTKGVAARGFGWDINSAFSRPRGEVFPIATATAPGSFGHTGFTGTSLWIDPVSDTYVLLLANAIHPRGNPPISGLRGQVATAAARVLGLPQTTAAPETQSAEPATLTGLDTLVATHYAALAAAVARHRGNLRAGLLTNQTGLDALHRRTIDILYQDAARAVPGFSLTTLFSPEHGILGVADTEDLHNETDPRTGLPVVSLYGPHDADKRPSHEALRNLDAVIIDLQDAGVRFFTYDTVVGYFLEAAAQERALGHTLDIVVLDRPNPLSGDRVQGPVSDANLTAYTNYMPLPIRHGMTIGELARYINHENRRADPALPGVFAPLNAPLTVVPMEYWRRSMYFDQTGGSWINPSPNLHSLAAEILYPGVELLQFTNVSVGRGTDRPFEQIGACWPPRKPAGRHASPPVPCPAEDQLDGTALAAYLNDRHIPGVSFAPTTFTVAEDANHSPYHGQTVTGVSLTVTDRDQLDSPELGIELLSALHHLYPQRFAMDRAERLIANINTLQALQNGDDPRQIAAAWQSDLKSYLERRAAYLLYR
ncbi:MAG: sodium/solute symporter [Acidobacteriota bacterium]|nr:sodium/solute symporter [Acidobacteriota bacterium]